MTTLIYMTDSYKQELTARVISCTKKGGGWEIILDQTIFYPQGGGQPSDKGTIKGTNGKALVKHVKMQSGEAIHECSLEGAIGEGESVECTIDWHTRYHNMRVHSAGHIVHEAVMATCQGIIPKKGEHGNNPYIEYQGTIPLDKKYPIETKTNIIVQSNVPIKTEFVTLEELKQRAAWTPEHLPANKPLRIVEIQGYAPIPDGGTQVSRTAEVGTITILRLENTEESVRVYYALQDTVQQEHVADEAAITTPNFIGLLLEVQQDALHSLRAKEKPMDQLRMELLGNKSELAKLTRQIRLIPVADRGQVGAVVNDVKQSIEKELQNLQPADSYKQSVNNEWFDATAPGTRPPEGHLHIVSQAISEITRIFERIGFTRVRHPEVDWDYYAFESLNMPPHHPARDEWETFFIESKKTKDKRQRFSQIVLTPHTSNGQVREMEKGKLPIRMINIAKCYRRQSDVSHVPMFHQFEGLYVDKNVSIGDLKGVMDFFFKNYYGPERKSRLRPFHFQFTEPSFEVDINCGVCLGKGCKLCKEGWLELGGAGMVHPNVLHAGGIDTKIYNGFAFGWGVERVAMMKSGTKLDDIRLLYGNDVLFLEQF
ncbi:phenylalanine--tRNA ligase subunit alpha [Candidatus Gottesmanbacteria bacterium]|nr:phenylalanine--tRNA ligase subunit alpha [Candidatus Gottesmanbacteria bacterium]